MSQFHNIWNNPVTSGQQPQYHPQQQQQQESSLQDSELSPDLLISRLNNLSSSSNYNQFLQSLNGQNANYNYQNTTPFPGYRPQTQLQLQTYDSVYQYSTNNDFNLPLELQGGVSNIQSRRPSFTAEQAVTYTTHPISQGNPLEQYAVHNNFNSNLAMNFRSRRPSIQISQYQSQTQHSQSQPQQRSPLPNHNSSSNTNANTNANGQINQGQKTIELENGLLFSNGFIVTSQQLQQTFGNTKAYFCVEPAIELYNKLVTSLETNDVIQKIIINLKKLNNLFNLVKPLVLVLTKSGKFEILSTSMNSNLKIQSKDIVICDGDRGKDLVYVLDGNLGLELAILINYLKKKQHARAISYNSEPDANALNGLSNTVEDLLSGNGILDEETQFQIPSKQILRFATTQEISNLKFKLIEEMKSYKTAVLKINQNPDLREYLEILASEYQFDQKKLTFYYRSDKRLDFRSLIKELFKIYKTRIWLCAVVNVDTKKVTPNNTNIKNGVNLNGPLDNLELKTYANDSFHVRIFDALFEELLKL